MKILAIESSCDETAVAVVQDGRTVLSSVISSQVEKHKVYGGVVPEIASRMHTEVISDLTKQALESAKTPLSEIDAIAVTYAPGLIGALLVGVNFAKGLALSTGMPLIPVHHLRSHIAANYLCHPQLEPPFMCLVVSGGHSHIIKVDDYTKLTVIGKTRDDAAGETFDKAARAMGLPYPGGVHLDRIADSGDASAFEFPRPVVSGAAYDFSFSGLKTAIINKIHNLKQKGEILPVEDLSAAFRETVVDCLTQKFVLACKDFRASKLVIAGGVAANSLLREKLHKECEKNAWELFMPEKALCGDNAAMVGAQGYYEYLHGVNAGLNLNAYASMSIEG